MIDGLVAYGFGTGAILLAVVTLQRGIELVIARRNTERLLARGAKEYGAGHYPLMVGFHASWLVAMWLLGWNADLVWIWVAAYAALQLFRVWILTSLGPRWTTRIIIINEPVVAKGPYRFIKHPNYWLVLAEIAVVPLALGSPIAAVISMILKAGVLWIRIRAENDALREITAR